MFKKIDSKFKYNQIIFKINNSNIDPIVTDQILFDDLHLLTKKVKLKTPPCVIGGPEQVIINKIAERGIEYLMILNGMKEKYFNPKTDWANLTYCVYGKLVDHYYINYELDENRNIRLANTHIVIKFEEIKSFFIHDGIIDFDGDRKAMKDSNLLQLQHTVVERIGFKHS